jgi:transposase
VTLRLPPATKIYLAIGAVDMRKGFDGLSSYVHQILDLDPFIGHLFLFRGKGGNRMKALYWDGTGLCLFAKRLEDGKFVWPSSAQEGALELTSAQMAMLVEGLDWRRAIAHREPPRPTVT